MTTATASGCVCEPTARGAAVNRVDRRRDARWLSRTLALVKQDGCAIVENVLERGFIAEAREALYRVQDRIRREPIGERIIQMTGGLSLLRLMFKFDTFFLKFLEIPEMLEIIDQTVSPTGILHTQNGIVLPPAHGAAVRKTFENQLHMDVPRVLNGYMASVNMLFAIDEFTARNGGTMLVPGSHQRPSRPSQEWLEAHAAPTDCPAGTMLVFDSTLYHAAGRNESDRDRLAVNNQVTRSFLKPQIDWVRALGDAAVLAQRPRTRQILGWYTRTPTSLEEFYRPEEERLYRRNQG